jgi:hypothetical protein
METTLAMFKTLAVLYLGWFTRTPTLATVFTPEAGDSNKLLVLAKGEFIFISVRAIRLTSCFLTKLSTPLLPTLPSSRYTATPRRFAQSGATN